MKFVELKKFLQTKMLNNYLLSGNDEYLIQKSFELIFASQNFDPTELNVVNFSEQVNFEEVVKALNTLPLMSDFKLVYVNLSGEKDKFENLNALTEYLHNFNETSILIINAGENLKQFDKIMGLIEVVDCNRLSESFVYSFITSEFGKHGKKIENGAKVLLSQYCLYNLASIVSEIGKLVAYLGSEEVVLEQHVKQIVTKNLDFQIFDLTEQIAKKNADKVYEVLAEIKSKKENDKVILPLISKHFRRLFFVKIGKDDMKTTAKNLGVKEYAVKVSVNQSKLFSAKALKEIVELCVTLDYCVKSGEMNNESAVNFLILKILNLD